MLAMQRVRLLTSACVLAAMLAAFQGMWFEAAWS